MPQQHLGKGPLCPPWRLLPPHGVPRPEMHLFPDAQGRVRLVFWGPAPGPPVPRVRALAACLSLQSQGARLARLSLSPPEAHASLSTDVWEGRWRVGDAQGGWAQQEPKRAAWDAVSGVTWSPRSLTPGWIGPQITAVF